MERSSGYVHLVDLRVCGGTSSGFPLMYRPPKLRVVPADVRLRVNLCGTSVGSILVPPCIWRDLCGLPVDVSSSQTACRAARTCWLRVNHQFDVLHRSLGVVASPGFQSSLFDGIEGLCDHSRTSSSGTFDEFSSRFRSLPASSGLQWSSATSCDLRLSWQASD